MAGTLIVLGALDTKAAEVEVVRAELTAAGREARVLDLALPRDVDKLAAMTAVSDRIVDELRAALAADELAGVIALGGAVGTWVAMRAMRELPFGLPKLMVTTLPFDPRPHLGASDIVVFPTVADILGANAPVRAVLRHAVAALVAMASLPRAAPPAARAIGATGLGVTTPALLALRAAVDAAGRELVAFHANGFGGAAFEQWIARGAFAGVIDLTTSELTSELFGGVAVAGSDRLRGAARAGIPQVVAPGGLDFVSRGPIETLSASDRARPHVRHSPMFTHVRVDSDGMRLVARELAARISATAVVVVPLRGFSAHGGVGGALHDPAADAAFTDELVTAGARVVEIEAHINEPAFARRAWDLLAAML